MRHNIRAWGLLMAMFVAVVLTVISGAGHASRSVVQTAQANSQQDKAMSTMLWRDYLIDGSIATSMDPAELHFLENEEATQVAVTTAVPTAPKGILNFPSPQPTTTWPSGIASDISVPLPSEFYYIENRWQGLVDGSHVQVYAGLEREVISPPRGVLVIENFQDAPKAQHSPAADYPHGDYLAPQPSGSLYISTATAGCLTLETDGETTASLSTPAARQTFYFNIQTGSWQSSCDPPQRSR